MPTIPIILQTLNTAVLSDTLDSLGLMQQAMKPFMRPLDDTLQLIGRARTGLYMPVYAPPAAGENPYEVEIALVDELAPGDVIVLACDGPTERIANTGIALPPDRRLLADLCAPRWELRGAAVFVESRDEIVKCIGRSPDHASAVILALLDTMRSKDLAVLNASHHRREHDPFEAISSRGIRREHDPFANIR